MVTTVGTIVSILDGSSRPGDPSVAPEKHHHLCEAFGLPAMPMISREALDGFVPSSVATVHTVGVL
jgi:hypothetical protein